jgi:phosphate/sulfate permease
LLLLQIVISWFLSPLAAALIALVIFVAVRTVVLRRANSTSMAFYVLPVLILITIWVVRRLATRHQHGVMWAFGSGAAARDRVEVSQRFCTCSSNPHTSVMFILHKSRSLQLCTMN